MLAVFFLSVFFISAYFKYFYLPKKSQIVEKNKATNLPTPTTFTKKKATTLILPTSFAINIPQDLEAKISSQTKQYFYGRFFLSDADHNTTYFEIESGSIGKIIDNPFVAKEEEKKTQINGVDTSLISGKENFKNSKRVVKIAKFNYSGNILVITLFRPAEKYDLDKEFDELIGSVSLDKQSFSQSGFLFIKPLLAAESVAGIPVICSNALK